MDTNTIVPYVKLNENAPSPSYISVPGLYDENGFSLGNGTDDFTVELLAYLDLPAGVLRFEISTDDGYKLTSGTGLRDSTAPVVSAHNGGPGDDTFDLVVTEAGLYPFRLVWYERGGSSHAEWYLVDTNTGIKTLINDPNEPAAIKAYTETPEPVFVESATAPSGPYAEEISTVLNADAHQITVYYTQRFVFGEAHVLDDVQFSLLALPSVLRNTIVVRGLDLFGDPQVFVEGVDYTVEENGLFTGLQKALGTSISDSGAVTVDYVAALSGNAGNSRFYRLRSDSARHLTGIQYRGDSVTLTYE
jgi:hypothetical protein